MFPRYLILIRHTQSLLNWLMQEVDRDPENLELKQQLLETEDINCPATEQGIQRAEWAGELYQFLLNFEDGIPLFFTSHYKRATQTAAALSKKWDRPPHLWQSSDQDSDWPHWNIDPNLHERSWGAAPNMSWAQFETKYPTAFKEYQRDPLCFRPPFLGAESILDVRNYRVERFIRKLERNCSGNEIVIVVAHHDWILACRSLLEDLDPFAFKQMRLNSQEHIRNLDAVCYTQRDAYSGTTASSDFPASVGMIHLPEEDTPIDQVQPLRWEKIVRNEYAATQLAALKYS